MSQEGQTREKQPAKDRISTGGILLVFLGIIFLLQSLSVLSWSLWGPLSHFWPVLLIIAGLNVLLKRYNEWLVGLLVVAILLASLGIAMWQQDKPLPSGSGIKGYSAPSQQIPISLLPIPRGN